MLELLWKRKIDKQKEKKNCNKLNSERNEHYCKFTLFTFGMRSIDRIPE